jgi:thymidylate kinase
MYKGLFIAVYGVNNIGKSTHCRILCDKLRREGHDVVQLKYPIYDLEPSGTLLNDILRGEQKQKISEEELQRIFTQNRRDFEPRLKQMLDDGKIVVAEDYTGTGIAWGMTKGLSVEFMEKMNEGLLKEDFALLITGHRDARAAEKHHIHEQNEDLLENVSKIFIQLAERYGWKIVELQQNIPDTAHLIWQTVKEFLQQKLHP